LVAEWRSKKTERLMEISRVARIHLAYIESAKERLTSGAQTVKRSNESFVNKILFIDINFLAVTQIIPVSSIDRWFQIRIL